MAADGLIDLHHHIVPEVYRAAIERTGDGTVGGIPLPPWTEDGMIERFDELGVERAAVSVSAPALEPIPESGRADLARAVNDEIAALRTTHPDRVAGLAVLPLPDVDAARAEAERALDDLGLEGVAVLTNYGGRYLGHEDFAPLLQTLAARDAVAHVHPNLPPPMPDAQLALPAPVLEFTFDTTRMVADLIATEALGRHAGLRLVLSHLGGTLPWVAWRLSMLDGIPSNVEPGTPREPVREQLRRLYYDVALSASPETLRLACDVVGADRIVYGSDTPFAPPPFVDANLASLETLGETERDAIRFGTATTLLS